MVDADGRRKQTDFLIKLPDDKHIIIDSKVSLAAYDRAVAAENDEQLDAALREHIKAVKRHIDDLQGKDYTSLIGLRSPSFVLMFMPIEPAYIEALKYEKDLFSYGYERGIVMVSHTTLIPILRTVSNLWSMERSTREARELGDKAGDIYNQVRVVAERLGRLGKSLQAANNHFNLTATALTGHQGLHGKVERFADMSSKVTKSIPLIEPQHSDLQTENLQLLAEPIVPAADADEDAPPAAQDNGEDGADERARERPQTVSST
jgi:DNA recombination protein RmuC